MPKKGLPSYRLHKRSGQAVVTLNGKDHYLGRYKSNASREEYERIIAEYIANGKKLPPTTGIPIEELGIHFLDWAEKYYVKNGQQTGTFNFCQNAISLLTKHYGNESVENFGPLSLEFLQEKWVEQGLARQTVNKNVCVIKKGCSRDFR